MRRAKKLSSSPFLAALMVASLVLAACERAIYEVEGTGTATITYRDGQLKTEEDVRLPWKREVAGSTLELKAVGSGELACSITWEAGIAAHTKENACSLVYNR